MAGGSVTHPIRATVNAQTTADVRQETFEGRAHLVAPVVAIVEGVLNGQLVPAEEISHFVEAWNGIPLMLNHPYLRGVPISANSPPIIEAHGAGRFWNASFVDKRLKGELWVDIAKATTLGGDWLTILERLEKNEPLEVSTAYFHDTKPITGQFNGYSYVGVQHALRPDHLALLPNDTGACSWADGCGAPRRNHQCQLTTNKGQRTMQQVKRRFTAAWTRLAKAFGVNIQQSFDEIEQALGEALRGDGRPKLPNQYCYVVDVYPDVVVYEEGLYDGPDALYRRPYTIDANGNASLGAPEEVVREVTYLPVTQAEPATNTKDPEPETPTPNPDGGTMPKKDELIAALVANKDLSLTEQELSMCSEDLLQKMVTGFTRPTINEKDPEPKPEPDPKPEPAEPATPATAPAFALNAEQLEAFTYAMRDLTARKTATIAVLMANKGNRYTEAELKARSLDDLDKLVSLSGIPVSTPNYTGRGGPRPTTNEDEVIPAPPIPFNRGKKAA